MKTNISWSELWTEVAVAFDKSPSERSKKEKEVTDSGLCQSIAELTRPRMWIYEIFGCAGRELFGLKRDYWWPENRNGDFQRATYAGLMAAIGYKEFKKMFCVEKTEKDFADIEKQVKIIP